MVVLQILGFVIVFLILLVFLLLMDCKVWVVVQMCKGLNVVGVFGLLQFFVDFFKFVFKEIVVLAGVDWLMYLLVLLIMLILVFVIWVVVLVVLGWVIVDINVGIFYFFVMFLLGVYGIIIGGWVLNLKYFFLGVLCLAVQMVFYEVFIGFIIVMVLLFVGFMSLMYIIEVQVGGFWNWNFFVGCVLIEDGWFMFIVMLFMVVIFFILVLVEINCLLFDLLEVEFEFVVGYQVEYFLILYLLFMVGEYFNIVLMCVMMMILFFGGWNLLFEFDMFSWLYFVFSLWYFFWFVIKVVFFFFMFVMVKVFVLCYCYDQLMCLGWKIFLLVFFVVVVVVGVYIVYGV